MKISIFRVDDLNLSIGTLISVWTLVSNLIAKLDCFLFHTNKKKIALCFIQLSQSVGISKLGQFFTGILLPYLMYLPGAVVIDQWVKVFKNGPSKICGRQPLNNFTWSFLEYLDPNWLFNNYQSVNKYGILLK